MRIEDVVPPGDRILITGASGFLGHELVKQLYATNPIRAMARNEGNLIALQQLFPGIEIFVGDVADECDCAQACNDVQGVFHLAGFKHVGLAEVQPLQCIETNVTGSRCILQAAVDADFVIATSTDKAARVAGAYGASKLLMERLFKQWEAIGQAQYRIVRYGNVLYSTGSVLQKWREAFIQGKEILMTDPKATRFYWTVDEAVNLLFRCLSESVDATPFIPQMKAMQLGDLFQAMSMKYGQSSRWSMRKIGLQLGENLHESLGVGLTSDQVERYTVEEISTMV